MICVSPLTRIRTLAWKIRIVIVSAALPSSNRLASVLYGVIAAIESWLSKSGLNV